MINPDALPTASLFWSLLWKIIWGVPPGKKGGNADLKCGVYRVIHQVKSPYLHPLCRLSRLVTETQVQLTYVIRSFQLGYPGLHYATFSSNPPRKCRTNNIKHQAPHRSSPWACSCRGSSIAYEACIHRQFVTRFPPVVQRTLLHVKLSKCQPPLHLPSKKCGTFSKHFSPHDEIHVCQFWKFSSNIVFQFLRLSFGQIPLLG